jgi:hypothetical protein
LPAVSTPEFPSRSGEAPAPAKERALPEAPARIRPAPRIGRRGTAFALDADAVVALQRTAGNAQVARLLADRDARRPRTAARRDRPEGPVPDRFSRARAKRPAVMTLQRKALVNVPHMDPGGDWTSTTDGAGRVKRIDATNLKLAAGVNAVPKGPFNAPQAAGNPPSWAALEGANLTKLRGPPHYVRMHMLNDRLGGPGNTSDNLAPGSSSLNSQHCQNFELPAMDDVLNQQLTLDTYWVEVQYQAASNSLVGPAAKAAWEDTIWAMQGGFTYTDQAGVKQSPNFDADEDVPGLDTMPNWAGN